MCNGNITKFRSDRVGLIFIVNRAKAKIATTRSKVLAFWKLVHCLICNLSFIMAEFNESEAPKNFDWMPEGCIPLAG
jgi:hypothetical protein